jgi:hypothetical protein
MVVGFGLGGVGLAPLFEGFARRHFVALVEFFTH